jgi:anti-anti-sigma regulatory factor
MAMNAVNLDLQSVLPMLQAAREQLAGAPAEVELDFSSVHCIDSVALQAMEDLARAAEGTRTKLILSQVGIDIYKVLKLTNVAPLFVFRN